MLTLKKSDETTTQKGKESHINHVGKIFIKVEFTLITYYKYLT